MPVLVYNVTFCIIGLVGVIATPCGPVHIMFTITATSILVFKITMHDKFVDPPAMISGFKRLTSTVDGAGTIIHHNKVKVNFMDQLTRNRK